MTSDQLNLSSVVGQPDYGLGAFHDLIFTRLDLPPVPEIDQQKLLSYIQNKNRLLIPEHKLHDKNADEAVYPWRAVYAFSKGKWCCEFSELFPAIPTYLEAFPTTAWRAVIILTQLPGQKVFLHTDPDFGIGWRVYLNHGGPRLYFKRFISRDNSRIETWSGGGPDSMESLCQPESIFVSETGSFPWALTSIRAAHGVEPNDKTLGARVTLLLVPHHDCIDHAKHQKLLQQSVTKYANTAIWY